MLDANLLATLANREPAGNVVQSRLAAWLAAGEELHAPILVRNEVASAVRKAVWSGRLAAGLAPRALYIAGLVPLTLHPPDDLGRALEIAALLGRRMVNDAVYLALAERLGGRLMTLDRPLVSNAEMHGLPVALLSPTVA